MRPLLAMLLLALVGCNKPHVRPYEWRDEAAAIETLAQRARSIHSLRAAASITLTPPSGDSINLDSALNLRLDDQGRPWLRLRAWKLGQAAFDITARPDGVWLLASDRAAREPAPALNPDQLAHAWALLLGGFFDAPGLEVLESSQAHLLVRRQVDGANITATVDRATLTPTRYMIRTDDAQERTLTLSLYRELPPHATPFPLRITASGPDGSVHVHLEDVELNPHLDDAVFTPPRRAARQP